MLTATRIMERMTPWLATNHKMALILALIMLIQPTELQHWVESPFIQNATLTTVGIEYMRSVFYPLLIKPFIEMLPRRKTKQDQAP